MSADRFINEYTVIEKSLTFFLLNHLEQQEHDEIKQFLHEYEHLLSDIPTRTNKIYHDVITVYPYRMNSVKQQCLKKEVKNQLDNDFIEPGQGNQSSPLILVPKHITIYTQPTEKINAVESRIHSKYGQYLKGRICDKV